MAIVLYTKTDAQCDKLVTATCCGEIFLSPEFGTKYQRSILIFEENQINRASNLYAIKELDLFSCCRTIPAYDRQTDTGL